MNDIFQFPTPKQILNLNEAELVSIKSGFRAKYIKDAASLVETNIINFHEISKLSDKEALCELVKIKGVGPKVASCVLIYSFNRLNIVPVDIWIKRGIEKYFSNGWPNCVKGIEGIAAQYLYNYLRLKQEGEKNA